jgi:stage V sporulation protein S
VDKWLNCSINDPQAKQSAPLYMGVRFDFFQNMETGNSADFLGGVWRDFSTDERLSKNGNQPKVWGEAGSFNLHLGALDGYPHYPQGLLRLLYPYSINIMLESIRGFLYNHVDSPTILIGRSTMDVIKVSANSRTAAVAGAIAGIVREHKRADVQAIGAGAVNQAVKALILATGYLKNDGIFVVCVPEFVDVAIEDKVRTAIKLVVEPR